MHEPLCAAAGHRHIAATLRCTFVGAGLGQVVMDQDHADGVRMRDWPWTTGWRDRIALLLEAGQHWSAVRCRRRATCSCASW